MQEIILAMCINQQPFISYYFVLSFHLYLHFGSIMTGDMMKKSSPYQIKISYRKRIQFKEGVNRCLTERIHKKS